MARSTATWFRVFWNVGRRLRQDSIFLQDPRYCQVTSESKAGPTVPRSRSRSRKIFDSAFVLMSGLFTMLLIACRYSDHFPKSSCPVAHNHYLVAHSTRERQENQKTTSRRAGSAAAQFPQEGYIHR